MGSLFNPLTLLVLALLAMAIGLVRLLLRLVDRGARSAVRVVATSSRSLFGPGGPPSELTRRLRERHPELTRGYGNGTGLAFRCFGCPGRLDFITNLTEIRFELNGTLKGHLEFSTPSFIARLAEDDPDAFRVRGSEELHQRIFKDPALPKMLRDWGVSFEWKVQPAEFFLQLRALPLYEEELWRWIKGSHALLQAVLGTGPRPEAQITRIAAADLNQSQCQVCGASLGQGQVVYCVGCATPHHDDCWAYAGGCSTFACQERRSVR